ncbi:MAG: Antitoxin Phd YefM, type toxin-antitoxin system [Verrucomicrobiota bacterium]|jgi:prevent-host-death family protein
MNHIPATHAKNRFGELLETVHREPIGITKKGRTVAVILSVSDYEHILSKTHVGIKPPAVDGILNWIDRHTPSSRPLSEQDYHQHLNDKHS